MLTILLPKVWSDKIIVDFTIIFQSLTHSFFITLPLFLSSPAFSHSLLLSFVHCLPFYSSLPLFLLIFFFLPSQHALFIDLIFPMFLSPAVPNAGARRVSFGPTARLSFSSAGRGMGGTGTGIFGEGNDTDVDHTHTYTMGERVGVGSGTGTASGSATPPGDGDLMDEHPNKFQKCLETESQFRHGYNFRFSYFFFVICPNIE